MPSLSELPGEIKRKKFIKALRRLGFVVDLSGGDGSHCKAIWPQTQKAVILPQDMPKQVLRYVLKEIEVCSGVTWEQIKNEL
ncbi:MAG: type II toxin-antitoxin system HicA family toxin [Patescibacteria group bacterium]|nr:type II toxin-antitoxin system HicA family toxin [Patescibacteria group bacterium]